MPIHDIAVTFGPHYRFRRVHLEPEGRELPMRKTEGRRERDRAAAGRARDGGGGVGRPEVEIKRLSYKRIYSMTPMEHLRAAMSAVDAYYKERGILQAKFGFGKNPALIVINMAYGWTDPPMPAGLRSIRRSRQFSNCSRGTRRKAPIIYTTSPPG